MSPLAAIAARRLEIQNEFERLKAEDIELARTEAVLSRFSTPRRASPNPPRPSHSHPKSHREIVIAALGSSPTPWVRATDIVGVAKTRWGIAIAEKSLRPLLTVMKREGAIARDGRWVALPERAREKLPPENAR